jgi:hypothetical protein
MKVLHLIIHMQKDAYSAMYNALSEFYRLFDSVDTYFVCFDPDLSDEFRFDGDLLWIRGFESLVPGILQKTIDGLLHFDVEKYDYIVRSNSSTIIDFFQFFKYKRSLVDVRADYICAQRLKLGWLDPACGITDSKYFGTEYASGTMIVLSREAGVKLLEKRHFLDYSVVDDVAIGVFFRDVWVSKLFSFDGPRYALNTRCIPIDQRKILINGLMKNQPVAWRNKSADRVEDAQSMQYICDLLSSANAVSDPR